jgi:hypothetical protein
VFASDTLRPLIVTCAQADDMTCVRQVITQAGRRVFRRPLLEGEIAGYQKAYARARARNLSHEDSLKEVLTALLASAQFVFRMELVPSQADTEPFAQYAQATRLSYLLWGSAPDSQLFDAAQRQELSSDLQLTDAVARLLDSPKSQRFVQNFAGQWLGLHQLTAASFDQQAGWTPDLANAASNELQAFFSELLGKGQDWLGFLNSRAHFVNIQLGALYDLSVRDGTMRVEQTTGERQGFLGMIGFLAQTSTPTRSSPSKRGAWILRQLLCTSLPDPPSNMPTFKDNDDQIKNYINGLSTECAGCHSQFDSFGLALENYDAIGRYRTWYPGFTAIDPQVTLPASVGSVSASGTVGVGAALAKSPAFTACTAQKLYTYGFGRAFSDSERPRVQALVDQWRSGPLTMRDLISLLVLSPGFRGQSAGGSP